MPKPRLSRWWSKPSMPVRYALAALSVALALAAVEWLTRLLHVELIVSVFICTLLFVAWFGGIGPAVFAAALAVLAFHYYLLPSGRAALPNAGFFWMKIAELPRILLFIVTALFVIMLSAVQKTTAESLRRSRDDLRRSQAFLADGQKISHTGSWSWNLATGRLVWSEEQCRIFGFDPPVAAPGYALFLSRVHPEDRAGVEQHLARARAARSGFEFDMRLLLGDGTVKYVHSVGHPIVRPDGKVEDYIGTTMDITERKRGEEALRDAQAELVRINRVTAMGELTAALAHEVNQPIGAAVTNAESCLRWLARDPPDLEEARAAAVNIVKDGMLAAGIITGIRQLFTKAGTRRETVDVNEIIREMAALLRSETARHAVSARLALADAPLPVNGDRVQLQQVMMNLILNGVEAMKEVPGPRELVITANAPENGQILVGVCDTGIGLPAAQVGRIFDAFYTTKPEGTGLGLAISRSIVEAHGGKLWATDNPPRGAGFYFTLPAQDAARQDAGKAAAWGLETGLD
jgi:PAS domain S-box-containing protein